MKSVLSKLTLLLAVTIIFSSCKKVVGSILDHGANAPVKGQFYEYIIPQGDHYANYNSYQPVQYEELKFVVRFDNSAIYQTANAANQEDVNKLYGFSDNNAGHQQYSARFGWNWSKGALRLYGYVYNNGVRSWQEIRSIQVGQEYNCSLKVAGDKYIFLAGDSKIEMSRSSVTVLGAGYKLYPYFGGDETAPHDVHIWIKE